MTGEPTLSVVMPVHNAGPYLRDCLDSVRAQTLRDIEVICVDDASSDGSRAVIEEYVAADPRFRLIDARGTGAGAARNTGLDAAQGAYLSFLDADDHFEPQMLERLHAACVRDSADVAVCGSRYLDDRTGKTTSAEWLLRLDLLPTTMPFSWRDIPDHILVFTSPAPWNKLFRAAFVRGREVRFQEIRRTNDLLFTKLAIALADRITAVDEVLVTYRTGAGNNLQSGNDNAPLEFLLALTALRDRLVEEGRFEPVERSFADLALSTCLYNLGTLRSAEAFAQLYQSLRDGAFDSLAVSGRDASEFGSADQFARYQRICATPDPAQYLLDESRLQADRARQAASQRDAARAKLKRVEGSRAFKISRRLSSAAAAVRSALRGKA